MICVEQIGYFISKHFIDEKFPNFYLQDESRFLLSQVNSFIIGYVYPLVSGYNEIPTEEQKSWN